jgi:hypothetical protein
MSSHPTSNVPPDKAVELFQSAVTTVGKGGEQLKELPDFVENRTSFVLVAFGAVVIAVGLLMMVHFDDGYRLADPQPSEYIATLTLGLCLMALGALAPVTRVRSVTQIEVKKIEEGARMAGAMVAVEPALAAGLAAAPASCPDR